MLHLRRNKLILAFPGMGKTPLSVKCGKFRDIDFGTFRTGLGYTKDQEHQLLLPFANYLLAMDADVNGLHFMSNEPKLMDVIHVDRVYLPSPESYRYAATKMGTNIQQIAEWVEGWNSIALKHNVPVVRIRVGLDKYFRQQGNKVLINVSDEIPFNPKGLKELIRNALNED